MEIIFKEVTKSTKRRYFYTEMPDRPDTRVFVPYHLQPLLHPGVLYKASARLSGQGYFKLVNDQIKTVSAKASTFEVPAVPKELKVDPILWKLVNISVYKHKYPLLLGPKGCGKSELARQLAKVNGYDFYEFDLGQAFKPKKYFLGGMILNEHGATEQVPSLFLKAFTSEKPTLIFLDELTRVPPQASNFLMTLLSRNQSFLYDDDAAVYHYKGRDVVFIAAGNTGLSYTSTTRVDSAFEDRFVKLQMDYLPAADEELLIKQRLPGINDSQVTKLVSIANSIRAQEKEGNIQTSLSTRQLLDAATFCAEGFGLATVVEKIILSNFILSGEYSEVQFVLEGL